MFLRLSLGKNRLHLLILLLVFAVFLKNGLIKQAHAAYSYQVVSQEAFDPVSTPVTWNNNGAETGYPTDDDYQLVNIGFTFYLGEIPYTQVRIMSNGVLHFGADQGFHKDYDNEALAITNNCTGNCPGFEEPADRAILGYWDDLEPSVGGTVTYGTLGAAPNRRFVASWENVPHFNNHSANYSFQIVLYENGDVRFRYGAGNANGSSATIGIEVSNADYTQYSYNSNSVNNANDLLWIREFPTLNSATASCTATNKVTLSFAAAVSPARANYANNFSIDNGITVLSATYINSTTVELTTDTLTSGTTYTVSTIGPNQNASFVLGTVSNTTFTDQFNSASYSNNDGSGTWTGNWVEIADDGSPSGGNVIISGNELRMDDDPNSGGKPSIYRELDLSGFTSATLTFDYDTPNNLENSDRFDILVSANGGASYTVIATFQGDVSGSASYDISAYIASNTRIRFTIENNFGGSGERMEIDNVSVIATGLTPCTPQIDHFLITHDGQGLTCKSETIQISACLDAACSSLSTELVSLDFRANGSLVSQPSFTGSTNVSLSQLTPATLSLSVNNESIAPANPFVCDSGSGSSCNIVFSEAGFILSLSDHKSCTTPNLTIQAVKLSDTGTSCAPAYTGNQSVDFIFNYLNPATGTLVPTLNGTNMAAATVTQNRTVNFDASATATLPFRYLDAGQISITVNDAAGAGLSSATVSPKISPTKLLVSTSDADNDCADANCSVFKVAGAPGNAASEFNLLIQGACADNTVTPNFKMNNIGILSTVSLPALGSNGTPGVTTANITANGGVTVLQTQSEVGAFTFTATPTENYLTTETVLAGTSSIIGRFIPAAFVFDTPNIPPQCSASFTYGGFMDGANPGLDRAGQNFTVSGNLRAVNTTNATTLNYHGVFAKLEGGQATPQAYNFDTASNDSGQVNYARALNFTNGVASFEDLSVDYQFDTEKAPFNLQVQLSAQDSDGVTGNTTSTPFEVRLGRLLLHDTYGPETAELEMPLTAEYFNGTDWTQNSADSCSSYVNTEVTLSNYTDNLNAGETSVTAPLAAPLTGAWTNLLAGESSIANGFIFSPPGVDQYGSVLASFNLTSQPWLQYDWDQNNSVETSSSATASFGYYRGSDRVIYKYEEKY